jgi:hypothetical protein
LTRIGGISEDTRVGLAMAASARERASRPRSLVLAAILLLLITGVAALLGVKARAQSRADLRRWLSTQSESERLVSEYKSLDAKLKASGDVQAGRKITDLFSRMEALAVRAGLKDKPALPRDATPTTRNGITIRETTYESVRDPSLKALLEWATLATSEIPGLEVSSLRLQAESTGWVMRIVFRRWEKQ